MKSLIPIALFFILISFTMPNPTNSDEIIILLDGLGEQITKASSENDVAKFLVHVNAYRFIIEDYNVQGSHRERLQLLLNNNNNLKKAALIEINNQPSVSPPGWTHHTGPILLKLEEYNISLKDLFESHLKAQSFDLESSQIDALRQMIEQQELLKNGSGNY